MIEINFRCASCGRGILTPLGRENTTVECPGCHKAITLSSSPSFLNGQNIDRCPHCRCPQFYLQRDFNRHLGLACVIGTAALSFIAFLYNPLLGYLALFGLAALDLVLYLLLPEIAVCYRCEAIFRRFKKAENLSAFDMAVYEYYRQKRLKGSQVQEFES